MSALEKAWARPNLCLGHQMPQVLSAPKYSWSWYVEDGLKAIYEAIRSSHNQEIISYSDPAWA